MIRDDNNEFFLKHATNVASNTTLEQSGINTTQSQQFDSYGSEDESDEVAMQLNSAIATREAFSEYFSRDGALSWRPPNRFD